MDQYQRWELFVRERLEEEKKNLNKINSLVIRFADLMKREGKKKILDLGCGLGRHMHYLAKRGFETVGTDISETTLSLADRFARMQELELDFIRCDNDDIPFQNSSFDGVICIDTIHHDSLENICGIIKEVYRILSPGGMFALNPPSVNDSTFGKGRKLGDKLFLLHRIPHYFFDRDELVNLLKKFHFQTEYIDSRRYKEEKEDRQETIREKIYVIARKTLRKRISFYPMPNAVF